MDAFLVGIQVVKKVQATSQLLFFECLQGRIKLVLGENSLIMHWCRRFLCQAYIDTLEIDI